MTLTKKHFNKIAEILNAYGKSDKLFIELIKDFGEYFKTENLKFDLAKFREACYKDSEQIFNGGLFSLSFFSLYKMKQNDTDKVK